MDHRRIVLVEDDPSLRRFVALALEELDIDLVQCATVAEGRAALDAAPARLIITDLMLPDESGLSFIEGLRRAAAALPRIAVFSAGLTPERRLTLQALGVWRLLSKPVSLAELEACVRDALSDAEPATGAGSGAPGPWPHALDHEAAIEQHFGGDASLYHAFLDHCRAQFRHDVALGDRAAQAQDLALLRRIAHSLKSVLLTLGHAQGSHLAGAMEKAAHGADAPAAQALWQPLRGVLLDLSAPPAKP